MRKEDILKVSGQHAEYLRDESRTIGYASSLSFLKTERDIADVLKKMNDEKTPVTVQGGRTGLAAAAVPFGGHILNLSRMNRITGMRKEGDRFFITVEPGVVLSELNKSIASRRFDISDWSEASKAAYGEFLKAPAHFFSTDPTETTATLGGMAACNASGARSYLYGPIRPHINALRAALPNGETLSIKRGMTFARGRNARLFTEQGSEIPLILPRYEMPKVKNASGYYIKDDMDIIDLFIGSDGTLGVITSLELALTRLPEVIWGCTCFFNEVQKALDFVIEIRESIDKISSIEYFDERALSILRAQKEKNSAFSALPELDSRYRFAVYCELHCDSEEEARARLFMLGEAMERAGGDESDSFVARTDFDKDALYFFRHAVPESVNRLIDERKKKDPVITKLGTDMSVPGGSLKAIMALYEADLNDAGLEYAVWGHIGDSHLHVNILPKDEKDYLAGKALYKKWAGIVTQMGGAVSAEHGVGKLKAEFLKVMYGETHIGEMARLKTAIDKNYILGVGNLFAPNRDFGGGDL